MKHLEGYMMRVDFGGRSASSLNGLIELGSGTALIDMNGKTILEAGPKDRILIQQVLDRLKITVNDRSSQLLSSEQSKNVEVRGALSNVRVDPDVRLPIAGLLRAFSEAPAQASAVAARYAPPEMPMPMAKAQLDSQLDRSPFLEHISQQLQKFFESLGGAAGNVGASNPRTLEQLVPGMSAAAGQIEKQATPAPAPTPDPAQLPQQETMPDLLQGILQTLQNFITQIQSGQTPDLQTLGSQLTQALQQTPGAVPQNAAPGNTPMEARKLPPGVDQKKAAEKSKEINEAIKDNDTDKLRELARDKDAMAMASPEEKAALVRALSSDAISGKDEKEREESKAAINFVLRSAGNGAGFRAILNSAGTEQVQQALMTGVKDPKNDRNLADFNITAGALGATEYATDPMQAKIATDAMAKGYTPQQVIAAREKMARTEVRENPMDFGRSDGEIKDFAEDPICMAVSTPQEKSGMIKQLMDGYTTGSEDRAMVSILESAGSKEEYDQIVDGAGGRKIVEEMDNDEAKKKFDLLAGAYDRNDVAMDQATASKAQGALTDPARTQYLMNGADENVVQPQTVDPASAVSPQSAGDPVMAKTDQFIANQNAKISAQVNTIDRRAAVETVLENSERVADGKPMINPRDIRNEVNEIMQDTSLTKEQREEKIEEVRKREGLSEYTMRNIATQPISHIYNEATLEAANFMQDNGAGLEENVKRAEARYGKESPEANQARARLQKFQQKIGSHTANLQRIGSELGDMYPPPKDFLEILGDILVGALKAFGPLLLNLIPGVGTTLFAAYQGVKTVISAVQGDILGVIGGVTGFLPGAGELLGGTVGQAIQSGTKSLETGLNVAKGIASGNPLEILNAAGGIAGDLSQVTGQLGQFGEVIKEGVDFVRKGVDLGKGIAGGDIGAITEGVGMAADQLEKIGGPGSAFSDIAKYAHEGIDFAKTVNNGDYAGALKKVGVDVSSITNNPVARELAGYAEKGISFTNNLSNGNYAGAFGDLAGGLQGIDNPLAREVAARAQQGSEFLTDLSNGDYARTLNGFDGALGSFVGADAVQGVTGRIQQITQIGNDIKNGDLASAAARVSRETGLPLDQAVDRFINDARGLLQDAAIGDFRKSFESLAAEGQNLLHSTEFERYAKEIQNGSEFFHEITSGEFVRKVEELKTQVETQEVQLQSAVREQIVQTLDSGRELTAFLKQSVDQQFWKSVHELKQSWKMSREIEASLGAVRKRAEYLGSLASGEALRSVQQYEQNLNGYADAVLGGRALRRFEDEARGLLKDRSLNEALAQQYNEARAEIRRQNRGLEQSVRTLQALGPRATGVRPAITKTVEATATGAQRKLESSLRIARTLPSSARKR